MEMNSNRSVKYDRSRLVVPKEHLTIARHFNAGLVVELLQVPEGRPGGFKIKWAMTKTMHRPFNRPGGTHSNADDDPALKRRAIVVCPVGTHDGRNSPFAIP
jgi:hypothetical protein